MGGGAITGTSGGGIVRFAGADKQFGSADCRSLCGLDLTTAEGRKGLAEGVKAQKCAKFVEAGARLLARELQTI
jgi:hypothetical protein